ncbi:hypothetical protein BDK51DRAFT_30133 [Blyttiomyces helicus]|uniref:CUE domain-containing protein n=1 Tax=Blyttiomyces helicus TaxID=388810 RepID=A0A4P9W1V4_9FUNG|nr:hypothetical protein BDK51DRAFT_30133 [Blyttiomyces helicus]|eukprot:RKO84738.1 hypothetical protein BDK51DRAFT_30133 [Blyttiomyces helicus]
MRASPFLLGIRSSAWHGDDDDKDEADISDEKEEKTRTQELQYELATARDIYLINDTVLGRIFSPLGAPVENILEKMYEALGSRWLSNEVKQITRPRGRQVQTKKSAALEILIHERALLLLYDDQGGNRELRSGAEGFLKKMKVLEAPEITIERSFAGVTNTERTTACLSGDREKGHVLCIAGDFDHFDVASALGRILFKNPRINDSLMLGTLLSTSRANLKRKGFPVERIRNLQAGKVKASQLAPPALKTTEERKPPSSNDKLSPNARMLLDIFPDADPNYIQRLVDSVGSRQTVQEIAARLLETDYPKAPVEPPPVQRSQAPRPEDLLGQMSKLTKSLGDNISTFWSGLSGTPPRATSPLPPSSTSSMPGGWKSESNISSPADVVPGPSSPPQPPHVRRPVIDISTNHVANLQASLAASVASLRPASTSAFSATIPDDPPLPPSAIPSTCAIIAQTDLVHARSVDGIAIYATRNAPAPPELSGAATVRFVALLHLIADVFGAREGVNVFWDPSGPLVAFNRGRTLFFNLRYYLALHHRSDAQDDADAYFYWFMTFAHELAHNFIGEHNAQHEHYFTSFAEQYLSKLVLTMSRKGIPLSPKTFQG